MADTTIRSSLAKKQMAKNTDSGLGVVQMARCIYSFAKDGGAAAQVVPAQTVELPAKTVIVGAVINSTTALTSTNACNFSCGTTAGSAANSILTATAKANLSADAVIAGVPSFAVPVKLSAKGKISVTFTDAAILTGVIEITIFYYVARA